jgi:hypothetical protein
MAIIPPDGSLLKPIILTPEAIIPQDGSEKQDCEINAAKRLIQNNINFLQSLGYELIILGDDIYSYNPFCKILNDLNFNYIVTCLPSTHKAVQEFINKIEPLKFIYETTEGRIKYRNIVKIWHKIPIKFEDKNSCFSYNLNKKDREDIVDITYVYHQRISISLVTNKVLRDKEGKAIHSVMSYATNYSITNKKEAKNVISSGRSRWIIENKVFNIIKNHGFKLEHNYGHGKNNLSINIMLLTLLAYNAHVLIELEALKVVGNDYVKENCNSCFDFFINFVKFDTIKKCKLRKLKILLIFFCHLNNNHKLLH